MLPDNSGKWTGVEFEAQLVGFVDQVRVITCLDSSNPGSCNALADSIGWEGIGEMP